MGLSPPSRPSEFCLAGIAAILAAEQFERLAEWFDRQRETEFDRQIQADANSGRLDEL